MDDNSEKILEFFDANEERFSFIESILPIYIEELNKAIVILKGAYAESNPKDFAAVTHKIKGSALTFGAKPIYTQCLRFEDQLSNGETLADIDLSVLLKAVDKVNQFDLRE